MTNNGPVLKTAIAAKFRRKLWKCNRHDKGVTAKGYRSLSKQAMIEKEMLIEHPHKLIDYTNCNEVLKRKNMTIKKAWELNQLLQGSGMAWARGGYEGGY